MTKYFDRAQNRNMVNENRTLLAKLQGRQKERLRYVLRARLGCFWRQSLNENSKKKNTALDVQQRKTKADSVSGHWICESTEH